MRDGMNRLAGVLGRRRRWGVGIWVGILVCPLPFAANQADHLTGGGFDVPGSQSEAVSEALQNDFGSQSNGITVLLKAAPDAAPARGGAGVGRGRGEVATLDGVTLARAAPRQALAQLRHSSIAMLPLSS